MPKHPALWFVLGVVAGMYGVPIVMGFVANATGK